MTPDEIRARRAAAATAKRRARGVPVRSQWPDRLWENVQKTDGCWLYTGPLTRRGYGQVTGPAHQPVRVHRASWELAFGPIPDGMMVCHHCDVRNCLRPDHLFLGTAQDNVDDMVRKGRQRAGRHHNGNRGWSERNRERFVGAWNPSAKMTPETVRSMRQRYANGESALDLARDFGIAESTTHRIVRGETWKEVTYL